MPQEIMEKIKKLKLKYAPRGFIILGVFGSYARGDNTQSSDIDILYEMDEQFYNRYPGWSVYPIIDEIQQQMQEELNHKVDLANKNALNEIGRKYILPEVVYV